MRLHIEFLENKEMSAQLDQQAIGIVTSAEGADTGEGGEGEHEGAEDTVERSSPSQRPLGGYQQSVCSHMFVLFIVRR